MEKISISNLYLKSVYKLEDFYRTSYYKSVQPRLEKLLYRFREDLDSIYLGIVDKLELDGDLLKSWPTISHTLPRSCARILEESFIILTILPNSG